MPLLTEKPYIPWELAGRPAVHPQRPPFLGAQAVVGRWTVTRRLFPPPLHLDVRSMAVISALRPGPGWQRLVQAEREAADLGKEYDAAQVDDVCPRGGCRSCGTRDGMSCTSRSTAPYDPNGGEDGLGLSTRSG